MRLCRANQQGAALVFTLGTLTLLLSLGSAMVANMLRESRQAEDFARVLQARLAAQAGLERAIAELRLAAESEFAAHTGQAWYWRFAAQPSYPRAGHSDSGALGTSSRYTLKIYDTASRIHLNDDSPKLKAILENLPSIGSTLANRIVGAKSGNAAQSRLLPSQRYAVKEQLQIINGLGPATFEAIRDFVTIDGYTDPNTMDMSSPGPPITYRDTPRSPVNVNTASPQVLAAVLQPLLSNAVEAQRVAEDLIAWQRRASGSVQAMDSWSAYEAWLKDLRTRNPSISATEWKNIRDNANPNRKHAWNKSSGISPAGKYATEFCFHSGGIYEIQSMGEVTSKSGAVLAKCTVTSSVPIFRIWNQTKKEQFRGEDRNGNLTWDYGEDANGNGFFERAEFKNVTWADSCPVNSSQETDLGYISNYDKVNDSLKLGFWEDFDEDTAFAAGLWQNLDAGRGSGYRVENSDTSETDNELHHTTSRGRSDPGFASSRFGVLELAYGGYREPYDAGLLTRPAWTFENARIRVHVVEDAAALSSNPDAGSDDVGQLGFRASGPVSSLVYARYGGIHYYAVSQGRFDFSTIYQNPLGGDEAWRQDAFGNPLNKAKQDTLLGTFPILQEEDNTKLPRPLIEGRVVQADPAGQWKESTMRMPQRVVFILGTHPTPSQRADGDGAGDVSRYVFGGKPGNTYTFRIRRTYEVWAVNRRSGFITVPGVRLKLSQEMPGGVETRLYPDPGGSLKGPASNSASSIPGPLNYDGEINTYIRESGTLRLGNHAAFPSWDDIRIWTSVGEYQSPVIDAGSNNVRWGTISWTLTVPASANPAKEKISFEPWTFATRTQAESRHLLDRGYPVQYPDGWPHFRYVDRTLSGGLENNVVGSGQKKNQVKGRLQTSPSRLVGEYPTNFSPGASPVLSSTLAQHNNRCLIFKAWLTSERYADAAPFDATGMPLRDPNPAADDPQFLRETPVLEDVTVTYIPRTRIGRYVEGGA